MADMQELIARLEAAEAGSRELDAAVWAASNGYELFEHDGAGWRYRMKPDDIMRHERTGYISSYTTSLDAALALAERVVGDREWMVEVKDRPLGRVHRACLGIVGPVYASTPALALCIAILKAKAQGEGG